MIPKEIWIIILRCVIAIFSLFIVTKILGKKQISHLTIYDYIIGITIGSIASDSIITLDETLVYGIVAIFTFGILGFGLSFLVMKSNDANNLINGRPTILMKNGQLNYDNLNNAKISISKFLEIARLNGYYDIDVLNYAILETNGEISFLAKEEYQTTNSKDLKESMKTKINKQTMCYPLIIDGEINIDILNYYDKDINWLDKELKKLKVGEDQILLATIDEFNNIKIYK